jgi:hypothetical protein
MTATQTKLGARGPPGGRLNPWFSRTISASSPRHFLPCGAFWLVLEGSGVVHNALKCLDVGFLRPINGREGGSLETHTTLGSFSFL